MELGMGIASHASGDITRLTPAKLPFFECQGLNYNFPNPNFVTEILIAIFF